MAKKNRFTSLDLRRAIQDLQAKEVVGMRLANVYDLNRKTYLFKFVKPDHKLFVVVESGIRVHATRYSSEKNDVPSVFAMKLRKHLRTKRLEQLEQSGMDRVFTMTFGQGEARYHLVVELYAAGNIVLTDKSFNILSLLRSYKLKDDTLVSVGNVYPHEEARQIERVGKEQVVSVLQAGGQKSLKNSLDIEGYEPAVLEHSILSCGLDPKMKAAEVKEEQVQSLIQQLDLMYEFCDAKEEQKGYIIFTTRGEKVVANVETGVEASEPIIIYEHFLPFLFKQFEKSPNIMEFKNFNEASDEFFSKMLAQKVDQQISSHEATVDRKLQKVREDHAKRIEGLGAQVEKWNRCAQLIEQNIGAVDECIDAIRVSLSNQVDWSQLNNYIKEARNDGNPIALMIHKLKLEEKKVTVLLYENLDNEENFDQPMETIDIDVSLTAYANAREYYQQMKSAREKTEKTVAAADQALKSAEKKAKQTMKETKAVKAVTALRKPYWFEKFHWFISSDNFIVVGGRDVTQNDMLYKRYLEKGDVYLHADLVGASSCIIKNLGGRDVPPITATQAGTFALCNSSGWKNKVSAPAYWVHDHQVSKTAPTGEFISAGGFMIRGKKNYINDTQLVMGYGILFKVADESIVNHIDDRKTKWLDSDTETTTTTTTDKTKGEAQPKHWQPKKKQQQQKNEDEETSEEEEKEIVQTENNNTDEKTAEGENTTASETANKSAEETEETEEKEEKAEKQEEESDDTEEEEEEEEEQEEEEEESSDELDESLRSSGFTVSLINSQSRQENTTTTASPTPVTTTPPQQTGKKKLSAYQKRQLKKGQQRGDEGEEGGEGGEEEEEEGGKKGQQQKGPQKGQQKGQQKAKQRQPTVQVPRGKKNKIKKMKEKYGWQDEEDRKLHMAMLGHKVLEVTEDEVKVAPGKGKKLLAAEDQLAAQRIKQEKNLEREGKRLRKEKEEEELRQLIRDEKIEQLTEEDLQKVEQTKAQGLGINLSALTGRPLPHDILVFALPVCAPYDVLRDYKYKVKVVPGTGKKGQGVKTAMNIFLTNSEMTPREKELIKAIPEEELLQAMISTPKVSAAGMNQVKRKK